MAFSTTTETKSSASEAKAYDATYYFSEIVEGAIQRNYDRVHQALKYVSINISNNQHSPVSLLASEGNDAAADYLIKNFNASFEDKILGMAARDAISEPEEFLKNILQKDEKPKSETKDEKDKKPSDVNQKLLNRYIGLLAIVRGASRGGHISLLEKTLELVSSTDAERRKFRRIAMFGLGIYGDKQFANKLLQKAEDDDELLQLINLKIFGLVIGGHPEEAFEILTLARNKKERFNFLRALIRGFASINNRKELDRILNQEKNVFHFHLLLKIAITQAYRAGHIELAKSLQQKITIPQFKDEIPHMTITGLSMGGHLQQLRKHLSQDNNRSNFISLLKSMIETASRYDHPWLIYSILRSYKFTKSEESELTIHRGLGLASQGKPFDDNQHRFLLVTAAGSAEAGWVQHTEAALAKTTSADEKREILNKICFEYARSGYIKQAWDLYMQHKSLLNPEDSVKLLLCITQGFAEAGITREFNEIFNIIKTIDNKSDNNIKEDFFNSILARIPIELIASKQFLIELLSQFDPSFHKDIIHKLAKLHPDIFPEHSTTKSHINILLSNTTTFTKTTQKYQLNPNQARAVLDVSLSGWLKQTALIKSSRNASKLNLDLCLHIASFLTTCNKQDLNDLTQKLTKPYRDRKAKQAESKKSSSNARQSSGGLFDRLFGGQSKHLTRIARAPHLKSLCNL